MFCVPLRFWSFQIVKTWCFIALGENGKWKKHKVLSSGSLEIAAAVS
jgi:hypothetical protein